MRVIEDNCVGCPEELGCLGEACPYRHMHIDYCDICGDDLAECKIDNQDMCEECAKEYLLDVFNNLTIDEKADVLEVEFKYIY